jgi:hypothetical protein
MNFYLMLNLFDEPKMFEKLESVPRWIIPNSKHCLRCDRVQRRRKAVGQPAVQEAAAPEARHPVAREGRDETGAGERVGQFLTVGKLGHEMVPERQVRQGDEEATGNNRGRVRRQIRP